MTPPKGDTGAVPPSSPTDDEQAHVIILAADTLGYEWVADPDDNTVYVDYRLDAPRFAWAVARGTLALHSGEGMVPEARRLNRHLYAVPDAS